MPSPGPRALAWDTRRLATLGFSSAATPATTREYSSRGESAGIGVSLRRRITTLQPARFFRGVRRLEYEDGDHAAGPGLVFGVGRVRGHGSAPPFVPLRPADFPGDHVKPLGAVLQFHLRVGAQIVIPERVRGRAAHRRDGGVAAVV